jgi:hypothetical protein
MVEEFCEGHDSKSQEYMQPIKLKKKSWFAYVANGIHRNEIIESCEWHINN